MDRGEHGAADRDSTTDQGSPTTRTPAALYRSGLQHLHAGRHLDAQLACQQALAIDAGHADSLRWLLDRDDSPWYPTVRLFRQDGARDFARVVESVRTELKTTISSRR